MSRVVQGDPPTLRGRRGAVMAASRRWHVEKEQELARLAEGHVQGHGGEGKHDARNTGPGRNSDIRSPGWSSNSTSSLKGSLRRVAFS